MPIAYSPRTAITEFHIQMQWKRRKSRFCLHLEKEGTPEESETSFGDSDFAILVNVETLLAGNSALSARQVAQKNE